ncbi:DNA helicase RecQ [Oceanomicrobium pacificus]|uniref:DNA helicase RecQ n=1 Tax=Oceanomicrobium pacificus TaxID=2692916 RepID=A0A6B0TUR5_9RHOB|nr:DNA helicase RecQ [Oceanomicrobium pacificus]
MDHAHAVLHDVFGFEAFRPGQEEIVRAILAGEDVLAIMPTGGGKSLCYQLPALLRPGVTVVISPLIALMRDQTRALREQGVAAGALTSGNSEEETEEVFAALDAGALKLLYMAPERLSGAGQLLSRIGVSFLAVDEAHCVSQWGHDFRPDYLRIGELRRRLGVPVAGFTATADAETRAEIGTRLFSAPPRQFLRGFDRPNLGLRFVPKNGPRGQVMDFVAARPGQSGIVYCGTRKKTEVLAQAMNAEGIRAMAYHGGMEAEERRAAEIRFQQEDGLVVCATVAFGMGIDKPDIRYVVHADLPKSIEAYYQEIGRAGRDGAPAETMTLFGADDISFRRAQIDEGLAPMERKEADHKRLNSLLGIAESLTCRRARLLAYFGETGDEGAPPEPCGNCDICADPPESFDGTEAAQKLLSAAIRTGEYFGAGHLISILLGEETEKVRARGHDQLPTFGVGRDLSKGQWKTIVRQMLALDILRPDPSRHGALRLTENARPVLRGEAVVALRKDRMAAQERRRSGKARALIAEEDEPLLAALKSRRRALAEAASLPAYMVFNDATLIAMATERPANLDAMMSLPGIGAKKLEKYGQTFLDVITGAAEPAPHPARRKLAGRDSGPLFDRLAEAARALERGESGLDKPVSLGQPLLARIAAEAPHDRAALSRISGMDDQKLDRFADAFLAVLNEG